MTPTKTKVSIIIVNWNGQAVNGPCLDALKQQEYKDYEVLLIDNASTDGSPDYVEQNYPWVKVLRLNKNCGFPAGNNRGLEYAGGDYIACLNNDTEADPAWLGRLVEEMDSDPALGICASKMIVYEKNTIDSAGDGCTTAARGYKRGEGHPASSCWEYDYPFGACAGAALYRRKMIEEIGFFDEDFFLIYEDADLNFRARLAGWKCRYVSDAIVHHKVRSTIKHMSDLAVYYSNRNTDFVWIKNMPFPLMIRFFHHKLIAELGSLFYFGIKHARLKTFIKAKYDVLKHLPALLAKRRAIQGTKKMANSELRKELTSVFAKGFFLEKLRKIIKS